MAADLTNTPIEIISSTAVSRGIESRLLMIDFSKNTWVAGTNNIFELPAGAALCTGSWWIHTTLEEGTNFKFSNGADLSAVITTLDAGTGGAYNINSAAGGVASLYSSVVNDLDLITVGNFDAGMLVIEVNWRDVGNAVTSGYREGDGTV